VIYRRNVRGDNYPAWVDRTYPSSELDQVRNLDICEVRSRRAENRRYLDQSHQHPVCLPLLPTFPSPAGISSKQCMALERFLTAAAPIFDRVRGGRHQRYLCRQCQIRCVLAPGICSNQARLTQFIQEAIRKPVSHSSEADPHPAFL
jgi:hypothetical protein